MSWQVHAINLVMRVSKFRLNGKNFVDAKAAMIKMADTPAAKAQYPDGAVVEKTELNSVNCEWVCDHSIASNEPKVIVYFHGGGFFAGSPNTHRGAAHWLSACSKMKALVIDYSLTPEALFPTQLNEAVAAYQWLLDNGYQSQNIAFGGDSAGGNMTIAVMKMLQQQQLPLPFAGFCISPWADLTHSGDSWQTNKRRDPMVAQSLLENAAAVYAGSYPLDDPMISPVFADYTGLPPLYLIAGESEVLLDDLHRIADGAKKANVFVQKKIWPTVPHAFTSMVGLIPEAKIAIEDIALFLNKQHEQTSPEKLG